MSAPKLVEYMWARQRIVDSWPVTRNFLSFKDLQEVFKRYKGLGKGLCGELTPAMPHRQTTAIVWTDDEWDQMVIFADTAKADQAVVKRRGHVTLVVGEKLGALFERNCR